MGCPELGPNQAEQLFAFWMAMKSQSAAHITLRMTVEPDASFDIVSLPRKSSKVVGPTRRSAILTEALTGMRLPAATCRTCSLYRHNCRLWLACAWGRVRLSSGRYASML